MATTVPRKLWEHPDPESTRLAHFRRELAHSTGQQLGVSIEAAQSM